MGQRAAGAAESDTDSAGIAVPRMAFKLGELRAGLVNAAVGVDIEMVVVIKLAVTPGGPVQIDLRDALCPRATSSASLAAVSSGADDVCICIVEMLLLDLIGKGVKPSRYI